MRIRPDDAADRLARMVTQQIRQPDGYALDEATGRVLFDFDPPLTPAELDDLADLVAMARSGITLTLAEYRGIKPDLAVLRTFRQQTQAAFMALTATQRDRALFDAVNAQTNVLRALLRD